MEPVAAQTPEPPAPLWLRLLGLLVACVAALVLAVFCAFLTPFRIGTALVPVSVLLVVPGLLAIMWFARRVTDSLGLTLLPGLVWLVISLVFAGHTTEGDLVIISNWVSNVYLLVGSVTVGVAFYRMVLPRRRP